MFTKRLFGSKIISDEDFSVKLASRRELHYEDDNGCFLVTCEGAGTYIDISHGSIRRADADENSQIGSRTDQRITENVVRTLEWGGWTVRVVT